MLTTGCSENEVIQDAAFDAEESWSALEQEIITVETWEDSEDELANGRTYTEDGHLALPACVTRTWEADGPNRTRILTIDFGDTYCLGMDGLYRKGVIVVTYVGPRGIPGSTKTTEFIGYFVMDHEFNGTKHIEFQGNRTYTREVDMTLTIGDRSSSRFADQVVEKIAGYQTPPRFDDIFQVTGDGGGVRMNGMGYTAVIDEPLLRKLQPGCFENFVDGTIEFTNDDGLVTLLDFDPLGGAPCDKLASITRDGETHFITLW
jgi:hypothetical protein